MERVEQRQTVKVHSSLAPVGTADPHLRCPIISRCNAWQALQSQPGSAGPDAVADGYRTQSELLSLPIEAVIQRALRERVSLILEGIHVHPMLLDRIQDRGDAIIVPIMLAVLKQKQLKRRLIGRGIQAPQREAERQLSYFDAIWSLQEYLLAEADRANVPIVANENREHAIRVVLHTIIAALSRNFSSTPREAFL